ncbi:MAG: hypothetical protein ACQERS_14320 [Bacteroidota bacterium]
MKKNLTLLTGIVLFITILIAGACGPAGNEKDSSEGTDDSSKKGGALKQLREPDVKIFLKEIVEIDGEMHLKMANSYAPDSIVIDSLYTNVNPNDTVMWIAPPPSGIQEIIDVRPVVRDGKIFKEAAIESSYNDQKVFMYVVPGDAKPGTEEKYEIEFKDKEGNSGTIDPHLRIPPTL